MDPWFYQEKHACAVFHQKPAEIIAPATGSSSEMDVTPCVLSVLFVSWGETQLESDILSDSGKVEVCAMLELCCRLFRALTDRWGACIAGSLWQVTVPLACISELQQSSYVTAGHVRLNAAGSCDPFSRNHIHPLLAAAMQEMFTLSWRHFGCVSSYGISVCERL